MLRDGLNFTLVTGDKLHLKEISEGLKSIRINTNFNHFDNCEALVNFLKDNHSHFYHVIMLDMDNFPAVGMDCLKSIRSNREYNNKIVITYSRVNDEDSVDQFFLNGGNIFFTYPKNKTEFSNLLRKLIVVNWKVYITGTDREHFLLKL